MNCKCDPCVKPPLVKLYALNIFLKELNNRQIKDEFIQIYEGFNQLWTDHIRYLNIFQLYLHRNATVMTIHRSKKMNHQLLNNQFSELFTMI